jgi:hypothetical protein
MATRMQQRRGTASQWTTANPILNAGEIGWESDTNKFKIGDGTNHWADVDYFIDSNSTANPSFGSSITFEGATANNYETTLAVTDPTADRTITLPDATGTVVLADSSGNVTVSGDLTVSGTTTTINSTTINATTGIVFEGATADAFETTLTLTDPTEDRTLTLPNSSGTLATQSYVNGEVTTLQGFIDNKTDKTQYDAKGDLIVGASDNTPAKLSVGTNGHVLTANSGATNGIEWAAPAAVGVFESSILFEGATANDFETTLAVTDPTADRTITLPDATGTVQLRVADVDDTEIGYLNGVTSAIQTQLNDKASASTVSTLSGTVDGKLNLSGGTMTGAITLSGAPSSDLHAATKAYVDSVSQGLHIHASVVAATTANVTLATALENGDVLDGVTLATGNRILVKNQTTTSENGIYVVASSGAPARATDFDAPAEINGGDFVFVTGGTVNDNTGYVQTETVGTVGTDAISFTQFSGAGTFAAGTGLTLTGSTFSIDTGTTVDLSTSQTLSNKTIAAPRLQLAMKAETGTSYTLDVADASSKWVTMDNSSAITVTVPPSVFATGDQINVQAIGTGQVTFAQGAGVTITSAGGTSTAPKIRSRYSSATIICVASNSFTIVGDLI